MKCGWKELLSVLPPGLRTDVDKLGRVALEEIHLRQNQPVELIIGGRSHFLNIPVRQEDLQHVVNTASRYSPWSASTAAQGYITAPGGHRIGMCGDCVIQDGSITGIRSATSLCIRVARAFPGIGQGIPVHGSVLILGPPGVGKTTLLRDVIRLRSLSGACTAVVDERGELFPAGNLFDTGPRTDVLTLCSKAAGVLMALKTMSPRCIAVDEVTEAADCKALMNAGWCGVDLLATAHAASCADLEQRPVYQPLVESGLFRQVVVLERDKSWHMERMELCT